MSVSRVATLAVVGLMTALLVVAACAPRKEPAAPKTAPVPADAPAPVPEVGSRLAADEIERGVLTAMDRTADPCIDFYQYACGGWLAANEIPADQSRWTRFDELREKNLQRLREILEAPQTAGADPRLATYYRTCMDADAAERLGADPIRPRLDEIARIRDWGGVMRVSGVLESEGAGSMFGMAVFADPKNPGIEIAHAIQSGLSLPDRDYYLIDDERFVENREQFVEHVARTYGLLGDSPERARAAAERILAFETELARISVPRAELRNPDKTYNKIDLEGLQALTPGLPWNDYLAGIGAAGVRDINVYTPEYFKKVQPVLESAGLDTVREYLRWQTVTAAAPWLSNAFFEEDFAFFGKGLRGQQEPEARWKRCTRATDSALGEMLGQAFVDRYFAGDSKAKALVLIHGIEGAFGDNLGDLAWMDDATRAKALEKLELVDNMIGYPDEWRSYAGLDIADRPFFQNRAAAIAFETRRQIGKIGKPVDKREWWMTPPTVNASYNPTKNQMTFPAGILQPPVFHRDQPMAMNFGAIGMVMGHELSHGFDDSGRKYDGTGKLTEWWAPDASRFYEARTKCVQDMYGQFEVQPGLFVNGELTLGENIADLGGIKQAFKGWQTWEREHGREPAIVDGLTNEQLLFVSYAQFWCGKARPEEELRRIKTDPHSPPKFRVIGPLKNYPQFAKSFQCPAPTPMNPEDRCEVW